MVAQAIADDVHDQEYQSQTDGVESDHLHPAGCPCGESRGRPRSSGRGTGGQGNLGLPTTAVCGHALGLVNIQRLDHEQDQQADTGMEEFAPKPATQRSDIGNAWFSRRTGKGAHGRHVL